MRRGLKYGTSVIFLLAAIFIAFHGFDLGQAKSILLDVDPAALGLTASAIFISAIFASLRIRAIAKGFGYSLSLRDSIAVVSLGQLGGLIFFQIFGQLIARGSYLGKRNIPFAGTVLITGQERLAAALVSFSLATIGAISLFHGISFDLNAGGFDLLQILIGVTIAGVTSARIWWLDIQRFAASLTFNGVMRGAQSLAFSAAVQLFMMMAYVTAGRAVAPDCNLADLAAAASLVMFAASIPISLAGWGIREMSAVAALGAIGMTGPRAMTVAINIGLFSILCSAVLSACCARGAVKNAQIGTRRNATSSHEAILTKALPVICAVLIFFNIHIPTQQLAISVNLADPVAILAAVLFLLSIYRFGMPSWRMTWLNAHLLLCSAAITMALFIGAHSIGWTQWAVTNKWLGWFMLLAYGATGALAARFDFDKIVRTFIAVGCAIISYQVTLILLTIAGLKSVAFFAGFAQNSNAFAFQCLMLLSAAAATKPARFPAIVLALVGIWCSGSRAGVGSALIVLFVSLVFVPHSRRTVLTSALIAVGVIGLLTLLPMLSGASSVIGGYASLTTSYQGSIVEHYENVIMGLRVFLESPFFGSGLGVFVEQWKGPYPLVIHSTPIWLLAEFGLVGALIFIVPAVRMFVGELFNSRDVAGVMILLALTAFSAMSVLHELLYQRTLWFLLGAALAMPVVGVLKLKPVRTAGLVPVPVAA